MSLNKIKVRQAIRDISKEIVRDALMGSFKECPQCRIVKLCEHLVSIPGVLTSTGYYTDEFICFVNELTKDDTSPCRPVFTMIHSEDNQSIKYGIWSAHTGDILFKEKQRNTDERLVANAT